MNEKLQERESLELLPSFEDWTGDGLAKNVLSSMLKLSSIHMQGYDNDGHDMAVDVLSFFPCSHDTL